MLLKYLNLFFVQEFPMLISHGRVMVKRGILLTSYCAGRVRIVGCEVEDYGKIFLNVDCKPDVFFNRSF